MRRFGRGKRTDRREEQPVLAFDGEPTIETTKCGECGESHDVSTGFVLADDSAFAVYWATWSPHAGEAWVDMTIGSWVEPDYLDHVTFGCRIGLLGGEQGAQCSLVQAAEFRSSALLGAKLSRDEALAHEWLPAFWMVIDWLMLNDPLLHEHVFHMGE